MFLFISKARKSVKLAMHSGQQIPWEGLVGRDFLVLNLLFEEVAGRDVPN